MFLFFSEKKKRLCQQVLLYGHVRCVLLPHVLGHLLVAVTLCLHKIIMYVMVSLLPTLYIWVCNNLHLYPPCWNRIINLFIAMECKKRFVVIERFIFL